MMSTTPWEQPDGLPCTMIIDLITKSPCSSRDQRGGRGVRQEAPGDAGHLLPVRLRLRNVLHRHDRRARRPPLLPERRDGNVGGDHDGVRLRQVDGHPPHRLLHRRAGH